MCSSGEKTYPCKSHKGPPLSETCSFYRTNMLEYRVFTSIPQGCVLSYRTRVLYTGGYHMNRYMQEKWSWIEGTHAMRSQLLDILSDADLTFSPGGQNMTL